MSRLYGSIDADASKTQATRRAYKHISGHIRGWENGVRVSTFIDQHDREVFMVYVTSGSNAIGNDLLIASVTDGEVEYFTRGAS